MSRLKPFHIIILTFCFAVVSQGQDITGRVHGSVIDKQSQVPIPGVTILINSKGLEQGTTTNTDGNFIIEGIPVGRFNIEFRFIGYEIIKLQNVLLTSSKDVYLSIEITEKIESIEGVVVRAHSKSRPITEFASVSARTFSVEESNKFAGSWGDPARMVSNYAGVVTAGDQRNDIIIRGNSPTGLLWRLEGVVIPNPNHFGTFGTTGGPISMLNNNQLSNSDFFTGAFPAEYGNALSGVFDLKMRNGNNQKHEFIGQMGFNGFELGAEGPFSKSRRSSYMINYRYTMMDVMTAMGMFDVGGVPNYTDISFKFYLPTESMGTFSVFGLGGRSEIDLQEDKGSGWTSDMLPGTEVRYGSGMGVVGVSNKYFLSDRGRVETALSVSHSNSFNRVDTLRGATYTKYYHDDYTETRYAASAKYVLKLSKRNTIQVGAIAEVFDFNFIDDVYETTIDSLINFTDVNEVTSLYQAYVQTRHRISEAFSINIGLHGQWFALNGSKIVEPRVGVNYAINKKHSLNFGYGLHGQIQPKLIYFIQTHNQQYNTTTLTNKDLGFSRSHHFVAGYDYFINQSLRLKAETYYQYLYKVPVEQNPSYFSLLNYGASFYNERVDSLINKGTGENMGVELTVEKFLSKNFYWLVTASIFDSKYQGSDNVWRNTAFNGNYALNILAGYELPIRNNALSINIKTVTAGGKRYLPINLEGSRARNETVYDYENAYANRFDDYFRVDLRISFRQNLRKVSQEWSFDAQNLTDHENILMQRFDPDTGEIVNVLQMGFFPIGSWRIYF